ncbi:MAG: hypothetical protein KGZ67_01855, partial [Hydrogenophaga sp.]|nr:hypothetical protein [Hydrogenophaga sp.]
MSGLAPATGGAAAVRPAQASGAPARPGSQEPGGDLFASLLLQVSDGQGTDEAAPDETASHATGLPVPAEPPWPGAGTTADFLPGFGRDTPPSHAAGHTPPAAPHGRAES